MLLPNLAFDSFVNFVRELGLVFNSFCIFNFYISNKFYYFKLLIGN